ncbi:MAG: ribonuclease R [Planctomycetes bacterium]|nr:ribonuclease R [Planctomycetota bacterium]
MSDTLRDRVAAYFEGEDYRAVTAAELREMLGLSSAEHETLLELLARLELDGIAIHVDGRGWFAPGREGWIVGRLSINRKGFGFVQPVRDDGRGDVFVDRDDLKDAHDHDLVLVRALKPKGKGRLRGGAPRLREGRVLQVLQRSARLVVGHYYRTGDAGVVEPLEHDSTREISVSADASQNARDGDRVLVRLIDEPPVEGLPSGEVIVVLGDEQTYEDDLRIICAEYGLPDDFPAEVEREASALPGDLTPSLRRGRVDRRDLCLLTIDPDDARDFDDAVTVTRTRSGYRLGVFIADVAAYVASGSAIDREAYRRATSVYLPGRVFPMLPERLSNDLCSLRPDEDRLARGVWMNVTPEGEIDGVEIERSVIRSRRRLTYAAAQAIIANEKGGETPEIVEQVRTLEELRGVLRSSRLRDGALALELDAQHVQLDGDGEVIDVVVEKSDESHQLIEECMLAANQAVARVATERGIAILRRVHPAPSEEDIEEFIRFCQTVVPSARLRGPDDFQRLVDSLHGQPSAPIINFALLRTLTQASYSPERALHFALAKEDYCHFTSPIRRYPDLQVHRALDAALFGVKMPKAWREQSDALEEVAAHCSERERAAEDAEREMSKLRVISWLRRRIGERFDGIISAVLEFGFFVRLEGSLAEGMVHVRNLGEDYFEYDERRRSLHGRRTGARFRLGDRVRVELLRADPVSRQVDLRWLPAEEGPSDAPTSRSARKTPRQAKGGGGARRGSGRASSKGGRRR